MILPCQSVISELVGFETAAQESKGTLHQEFEAVPMEIESKTPNCTRKYFFELKLGIKSCYINRSQNKL